MKAHTIQSQALSRQTTVPVMSASERHTFRGLALLWFVAVTLFAGWWCWPTHVVSLPRFLVTSFVIGYTLLMPAYFLFFVGRMRRPNPDLALPDRLRVSFATTFVPGAESIEVLERTISAMRDQEGYEHDVWVLDEGDLPQVREVCRRVGAYHFSRKGFARYQAQEWPFKKKTKAGNYNAWLEWLQAKGIHYDVLLQMDTDHVPKPGYMLEMLRPFADPAVAYVAAPSITSANQTDSWVVRARYEIEATLHGALQMGYNGGYAPLIIGSHAAFRVSSLRDIGGFQHTLAEDHHNTLRFTASGMHGVFSPDAIAIGEGASSFADAMVQEYQWARALTQILLNFFPRDGRTLAPHLWIQFLFAETWYPLFAFSQALGWLVPIVALLTRQPWVQVSYIQFVILHCFSTVLCVALVIWLKRRGWLRPVEVPAMSWRSALLMLARWPVVLMAVLEAVAGRIVGRDFPFRVTPKGSRDKKPLPVRSLLPYIVLVTGSFLAIGNYLRVGGSGNADGYLYLALVSAAIYLLLIIAVVFLNQRENVLSGRVSRLAAWRMHTSGHGAVILLVAFFVLFSSLALPKGAEAALGQPDQVRSAVHLALSPSDSAVACPESVARPSTGPACPVVGFPLGRPFVGVYDPNKAVNQPVDVEEVFVQWKPAVGDEIHAQVQRILGQGRVPMVTIEPYPWNIDGLTDQTLLTDISSGRYDNVTRDIAATVHQFAPAPVYIRFGHEMDFTGLYPWGKGDPNAYIAAYRHFVDGVRASASNAKFIWSPSGSTSSEKYYPGSDVVDLIGVTLLVADEWTSPQTAPSFASALQPSYRLAGEFGKPLVVCELGLDLYDQDAKTHWLSDARSSLDQFPQLLGIVYFDDHQPYRFAPTGLPDWRLNQAQQEALFARATARNVR